MDRSKKFLKWLGFGSSSVEGTGPVFVQETPGSEHQHDNDLSQHDLPRVRRLKERDRHSAPVATPVRRWRSSPSKSLLGSPFPRYNGIGLLPRGDMTPPQRPILSRSNTLMKDGPLTVKIARPSPSLKPTISSQSGSFRESPATPKSCDTKSIISALREKRKRDHRSSPPKLEEDKQVKRRNATNESLLEPSSYSAPRKLYHFNKTNIKRRHTPIYDTIDKDFSQIPHSNLHISSDDLEKDRNAQMKRAQLMLEPNAKEIKSEISASSVSVYPIVTSTASLSHPVASAAIPSLPVTSTTAPSFPVASTTAPSLPVASTTAPSLPVASTTAPSLPVASTTAPSLPVASTTAPSLPVASTTAPSLPVASTAAPSLPDIPSTTSLPVAPSTTSSLPVATTRAYSFAAAGSSGNTFVPLTSSLATSSSVVVSPASNLSNGVQGDAANLENMKSSVCTIVGNSTYSILSPVSGSPAMVATASVGSPFSFGSSVSTTAADVSLCSGSTAPLSSSSNARPLSSKAPNVTGVNNMPSTSSTSVTFSLPSSTPSVVSNIKEDYKSNGIPNGSGSAVSSNPLLATPFSFGSAPTTSNQSALNPSSAYQKESSSKAAGISSIVSSTQSQPNAFQAQTSTAHWGVSQPKSVNENIFAPSTLKDSSGVGKIPDFSFGNTTAVPNAVVNCNLNSTPLPSVPCSVNKMFSFSDNSSNSNVSAKFGHGNSSHMTDTINPSVNSANFSSTNLGNSSLFNFGSENKKSSENVNFGNGLSTLSSTNNGIKPGPTFGLNSSSATDQTVSQFGNSMVGGSMFGTNTDAGSVFNSPVVSSNTNSSQGMSSLFGSPTQSANIFDSKIASNHTPAVGSPMFGAATSSSSTFAGASAQSKPIIHFGSNSSNAFGGTAQPSNPFVAANANGGFNFAAAANSMTGPSTVPTMPVNNSSSFNFGANSSNFQFGNPTGEGNTFSIGTGSTPSRARTRPVKGRRKMH